MGADGKDVGEMVRFTDPDEFGNDIDEDEDQFDETESEQDHEDDPER